MTTILVILGIVVLVLVIAYFSGKTSKTDIQTAGKDLSAAGKAVGQAVTATVGEVKADVGTAVKDVKADLGIKAPVTGSAPASGSK